jgi:ABC-type nitrate/sulfonate/bicarbonate transport system permease component
MNVRMRRAILTVAGAFGALATWEVLGRVGWFGESFPPLTDVFPAIAERSDLLVRSSIATIGRAAVGYAGGVAVSFGIAILVLLVPRLEPGVYRLAVVVNAIPIIALGPLVQVLGWQAYTPAIFAAMLVFFTTMVAVTRGFHSGSAATHDVLSTLGSSRWQRFSRLQLPDAVPSIADGLRIAAPTALVGALLGEWFGAERGLGVLMINAMRNFDVPLLWAAALVAVAISALVYWLLGVVETLAVERFARTVQTRGILAPDITIARSRASRLLRWASRFWAVAIVIAAWQLWIVVGHVDAIVMPTPASVGAYVVEQPGTYLVQAGITSQVAIGGLVAGLAAGLLLAVVAWLSPTLSALIRPAVLVIPTIPIVVIIPVVASIVGFNRWTVLLVAVLLSFFPVFVLATSGLQYRPSGADDVFSALGASRLKRLRHLALPSAVPNLLTAVRISAAACFLGALVAEWLVGTSGLGELFRESRALLQPQRAWGAIAVGVVVSVAAYLLAYRAELWGRERWS